MYLISLWAKASSFIKHNIITSQDCYKIKWINIHKGLKAILGKHCVLFLWMLQFLLISFYLSFEVLLLSMYFLPSFTWQNISRFLKTRLRKLSWILPDSENFPQPLEQCPFSVLRSTACNSHYQPNHIEVIYLNT